MPTPFLCGVGLRLAEGLRALEESARNSQGTWQANSSEPTHPDIFGLLEPTSPDMFGLLATLTIYTARNVCILTYPSSAPRV